MPVGFNTPGAATQRGGFGQGFGRVLGRFWEGFGKVWEPFGRSGVLPRHFCSCFGTFLGCLGVFQCFGSIFIEIS